MTTAYTSLLGLALPVTGELSGTWGDTVNTAITSLLDSAVAGTTSITVDADITLTSTTGASNEARQAIILWNPASGTTTRNITAPAQSKLYTVINASGGTQSIVIRGAGPTTGVTIAKGEAAMVAWNGSDFVKVSSSGGALTLTNLTVTGNTILGDAAADTLTVNATSTFAAPVSFQGLVNLPSTGRSAAAALTVTAPAFLYGVASTYTDTTSSGTIAAMAPFYSIARPTLSTSNVTTYTNAATLYIANSPAAGGSATITNPFALYVDSGANYFGGAATFNSTLAVNGNTTLGDATGDTLTINAGTTTFVQGTANGVAYLNGSKVLTTGSALVFDGTNLAVGVSSPGAPIGVQANASAIGLRVIGRSTGDLGYITFRNNANSSDLVTLGGQPAGFSVDIAGTEGMRLTSTGLGIGTNSPSVRLQVEGAANSAAITLLRLNNSGTTGGGPGIASRISFTASATSLGFIQGSNFASGEAGLQFSGDGSTVQATFNGSGSFLIGRTSVIGTNNRLAIQMATTSASGYTAASNAALAIDAGTSTNCVLNLVGGGDMGVFRTNSSNAYDVGIGFGDNSTRALSFTTATAERARIDSSGRFMVGNTFAFSNAISAVGTNTVLDSFGQLSAITTDSQAAGVGGQVTLGGKYRNIGGSPDYCGYGAIAGRKENSTDGNYAGYLQFIVSNHPSGQIERARIASTGNMGIGTTDTSNGRLNVVCPTAATGNSLFLTNVDGTYNPYVQFQHNGINGVTLLSSSSFGSTASNFTISVAATDTAVFSPGRTTLRVGGGSSATSVDVPLTLYNNLDGGVGMNFVNGVTSNTNPLASIRALVTSSGAGTDDGVLAFYTSLNGGIGERARINNIGQLLVNTTTAFNSEPVIVGNGGPYPLWVQGTSQGYTQGGVVIASGTADSPSGRGLGVYMWNQGTTATWYTGTAYGSADNWFIMRKTGANFRADTADVGLGWLMLMSASGAGYQGNNSSTWSTTSDARVKDDVKTIENGLDVVLALRPVDFYNKVTKKREENFIAQEYEQVLANHVYREAPIGAEQEFVTDEILRLNPNLVPYLVSAIQKLNAEIEALKATRN